MLDQLILHNTTRMLLQAYINNPGQGLMLIGKAGSGKSHIALSMLTDILGQPSLHKLREYAYLAHISPVKNAIGIDQIRSLKEFTNLRTPGTAVFRRGILIEDAQCLSLEAQNAFLKLLEEPPQDTIIVL